jgi:tRNA threonylcarbamoyladenosine biosynthesis protein TsaE
MEIVYALKDIDKAASDLMTRLQGIKVLAFSGEMGAGKTTFIHALCHQMGVKGTLSSPTFSIINEYETGDGMLYHIDLYRCKNEEEAVRAGVEDCLYSGYTCLVEWPSRAEGIFPEDTMRIGIKEIDGHTRKITLEDP